MNLLLKYNQYLKEVYPTKPLIINDPGINKIKFTLTKEDQINQNYTGGKKEDNEKSDKDIKELTKSEIKIIHNDDAPITNTIIHPDKDEEFELKYTPNNYIIILGGLNTSEHHNKINNKVNNKTKEDKKEKVNKEKVNKEKENKKEENKKEKDKKKDKVIYISCTECDKYKLKLINDLKKKYGETVNISDKKSDNDNINVIISKSFYVDNGKVRFEIPEADHLFYISGSHDNLKKDFMHKDPKLSMSIKVPNYFDKQNVKECKKHNNEIIDKYLMNKKKKLDSYHKNFTKLNSNHSELYSVLDSILGGNKNDNKDDNKNDNKDDNKYYQEEYY